METGSKWTASSFSMVGSFNDWTIDPDSAGDILVVSAGASLVTAMVWILGARSSKSSVMAVGRSESFPVVGRKRQSLSSSLASSHQLQREMEASLVDMGE